MHYGLITVLCFRSVPHEVREDNLVKNALD